MGLERNNKRLLGLGILVSGMLLSSGCANETMAVTQGSMREPTKEPTLPPRDETQEVLDEIHAEVARLIDKFQPNPVVANVYYREDLTNISPIFIFPTGVGIADPTVAYARTHFGAVEYSPQKRFTYYLGMNGSLAEYATLESMDLSVYFSPVWLNSQVDEVKILALEKEAYTIAQWTGFSTISLGAYQREGVIERLDPTVTGEEIANTLSRNFLIESSDILKLYDYAGYIPIMERVGEIINSGDEQAIEELKYSNLFDIYTRALEAGVDFRGVVFGTEEYFRLAFSTESPWVNMILDPDIPKPNFIFPEEKSDLAFSN